MRYIKTYEDISDKEFLDIKKDFKKDIDSFIEKYHEFIMSLSQKHYRTTGTLYRNLSNFSKYIDDDLQKVDKKTISIHIKTYKNKLEQEWVINNFPELIPDLMNSVELDPELRKKYAHLIDSSELGLI